MGRLTKDVELRKTQTNKSVASFTVAVNGYSKDQTNFIPVTAWNQTAEFLAKYARKGNLVSVEGSLTTSTYESEGKKIFKMDVTANSVQLLESKKKDEDTVQGKVNGGSFSIDIEPTKKNVDIDTDALPFY